jgi:hypothetical protein
MGAWGLEAFDSDSALDYIYDFEGADDIRAALQSDDDEWIDKEAKYHIIAEIMAAARGRVDGVYQSKTTGLFQMVMGADRDELDTVLGGSVYVPQEIMDIVESGDLSFTEAEVAQVRDYLVEIISDPELEIITASGWNSPTERAQAIRRTLARLV